MEVQFSTKKWLAVAIATVGLASTGCGGGGGGSDGGSGGEEPSLPPVTENKAPTAQADTFSSDEDVQMRGLDVLSNDQDPEGDTLQVTSARVDNGSVSVNSDGSLDYTPPENFAGKATITYVVSDGNAQSEGVATIQVNPVNDLPVARDDTATVYANTSDNAIQVLDNDEDVEDKILTVDSAFATEGSVNVLDGKLYYTPPADFVGTDIIQYNIVDSDGATASAVAQLEVVEGKALAFRATWTAPVQRENGESLSSTEIQGYEIVVEDASTAEEMSTTFVSGGSTQSAEISLPEAGTYNVRIAAVDLNGVRSSYSPPQQLVLQ